jgi:hypothetical protein
MVATSSLNEHRLNLVDEKDSQKKKASDFFGLWVGSKPTKLYTKKLY